MKKILGKLQLLLSADEQRDFAAAAVKEDIPVSIWARARLRQAVRADLNRPEEAPKQDTPRVEIAKPPAKRWLTPAELVPARPGTPEYVLIETCMGRTPIWNAAGREWALMSEDEKARWNDHDKYVWPENGAKKAVADMFPPNSVPNKFANGAAPTSWKSATPGHEPPVKKTLCGMFFNGDGWPPREESSAWEAMRVHLMREPEFDDLGTEISEMTAEELEDYRRSTAL